MISIHWIFFLFLIHNNLTLSVGHSFDLFIHLANELRMEATNLEDLDRLLIITLFEVGLIM